MTERTFEVLNEEGVFSRLLDLILNPHDDEGGTLRRLLMELLYEMARIQKVTLGDLCTCAQPGHEMSTALCIGTWLTEAEASVGDDFVSCLFDIIEQVSNDVSDPYHYPVVRVLVSSRRLRVAALTDHSLFSTSSSCLLPTILITQA